MGFLVPNQYKQQFNDNLHDNGRHGVVGTGDAGNRRYICFVKVLALTEGVYTGDIQVYSDPGGWTSVNSDPVTVIEINGEMLDMNRRYLAVRVGGGVFCVIGGGICTEVVKSFDAETCVVTNIWVKLPPNYDTEEHCDLGSTE